MRRAIKATRSHTRTLAQGAKGDKGDKGDTGVTGATGATGAKGDKGADGKSATISIGTVTTGAAGSNASVTNSGTSTDAVLNFTIPKGDKGADGKDGTNGNAATIRIGTVITGTAGSEASVTNSGTSSNAVLNFVIPRGDKGENGEGGSGAFEYEDWQFYFNNSQPVTKRVVLHND